MKSRILTDAPSAQPIAEPIAILFFVLGFRFDVGCQLYARHPLVLTAAFKKNRLIWAVF